MNVVGVYSFFILTLILFSESSPGRLVNRAVDALIKWQSENLLYFLCMYTKIYINILCQTF